MSLSQCLLIVGFGMLAFRPQQSTYVHIPTCLHLFFQIAENHPCKKIILSVWQFSFFFSSVPSLSPWLQTPYAPGLSRRVLQPFSGPRGSWNTRWQSWKSRQQLHLRASVVKVGANYDALIVALSCKSSFSSKHEDIYIYIYFKKTHLIYP